MFFLGTASGLPVQDRFSQTIVLELNGELHIIDPADAASSLLARARLDHRKIRSVVVSHMHADHHVGLIQVLKTAMHLRKQTSIQILFPSEGIEPLTTFLNACYLPIEWLGYPVDIHGITAEPHAVNEHLVFEAQLNKHLNPYRARAAGEPFSRAWQYQSYSFAITAKNRRFVYTGNLGKGLQEIAGLISEDSVLITEAAHLKVDDILAELETLQPCHTYLTHFHPSLRAAELQEAIVRRGLSERVTLAYDGLVCEFD